MKRAAILLFGLAIGACDSRRTPAAAYQRLSDRLSVAVGLPPFGCFRDEEILGDKVSVGLPNDQCVKFDPPKRWRGLWLNDFEGSQFCAAPAKRCQFVWIEDRREPQIWLDTTRVRLPQPLGSSEEERFGGLYAVEFIGRRTKYAGSYGHMGVFDHDMIVDRMISMKTIQAPPER